MFPFWRKRRDVAKLEEEAAIPQAPTATQPIGQSHLESSGKPARTEHDTQSEASQPDFDKTESHQSAAPEPPPDPPVSTGHTAGEVAEVPAARARSDDTSATLATSVLSQVDDQDAELKTQGPSPTMVVDQPQAAELTITYFTPGSYAGLNPEAQPSTSPYLSGLIRHSRRTRQPAGYELSGQQATSDYAAYLVTQKTASVAEALQAALPPGALPVIDPILAGAFLTRAEADPRVPRAAVQSYLEDPAILIPATQLLNRVVQNWADGGRPVRLDDLLAMAREIIDDPPTALLLCYDVTRAFANYSLALRWHMLDRKRGEYTDGSLVYTAKIIHPDCVPGPADNPIFFALFAGPDLASHSPPLWARHCAIATATAYAAKSRLAPHDAPLTEFAITFTDAIETTTRSMIDPLQSPNPGYRAWLWANALSFAQLADLQATEAEMAVIGRADLHATAFGLTQVGAAIDAGWRWYVPSVDTVAVSGAAQVSASPSILDPGRELASAHSEPETPS
jgi:hypothetical protein